MNSAVKTKATTKQQRSRKPREPKRYSVVCPGCKVAYMETNERFVPDVPLRGYMLQMAEPYRSWMWTRPGSDHDLGPAIECPGCGSPIVQGNRDKPMLEKIEEE